MPFFPLRLGFFSSCAVLLVNSNCFKSKTKLSGYGSETRFIQDTNGSYYTFMKCRIKKNFLPTLCVRVSDYGLVDDKKLVWVFLILRMSIMSYTKKYRQNDWSCSRSETKWDSHDLNQSRKQSQQLKSRHEIILKRWKIAKNEKRQKKVELGYEHNYNDMLCERITHPQWNRRRKKSRMNEMKGSWTSK